MKKVYIKMKEWLIPDYAIADYDDYLLEAHKAAENLAACFGKSVADTHYIIMNDATENHVIFRHKSKGVDSLYPYAVGNDHALDAMREMLSQTGGPPLRSIEWHDFEPISADSYENAILKFYNMEQEHSERIQHPKANSACPF